MRVITGIRWLLQGTLSVIATLTTALRNYYARWLFPSDSHNSRPPVPQVAVLAVPLSPPAAGGPWGHHLDTSCLSGEAGPLVAHVYSSG